MKQFSTKVIRILSSRRFFVFVMIFFVFEAAWIALSAVYPQAFDEEFHFGLIQIYSHYWLPFLSHQPANANAYGAVARDPSYLYHYLMSFPYRVISLFLHTQIEQVIALRLVNVGLFATGLVLFRRVLLKVGLSVPLANLLLLLFILVPITPLLAAQINYDNLLIPLIGWICLLTFRFTDEINKKKPTIKTLVTLVSACLLTSLVQYEFMPIFLAVVLFALFIIFRSYKGEINKLLSQLWQNWLIQRRLLKVVLLGALLISAGLFIQRDGVNIVKYHEIAPDCSSILSVKDCSAYGVWYHQYTLHQAVLAKEQKLTINPVTYTAQWIYWLWYRLFFAVNGPASDFTNYPPLPLPSAAFIVIELAGLYVTLKWCRRVFNNNPYIAFLALVTILYLATLLIEGYARYRYTGELELMNGRYLLPVLLLAAAVVASAFSIALKKKAYVKGLVAALVIVLFLQGGGFLTFIARSDSSWDFSNKTVVKVNNAARRIMSPVIVNGQKTYGTSYWFFN